MPYQLIPAAAQSVSLWAGGETRQLAISPPAATVAAQNFHWRFSSATVRQDGVFSHFPQHQRLLALRQGAGFVLHVDAHQQHLSSQQQVLRFAGSADCRATLSAGPVVDINLMLDATLQANLWSQRLTCQQLHWPRPVLAGATLLVYADEAPVELCLQLDTPPLYLATGDVLQITAPTAPCWLRAATVPCSVVLAWLAPA